MEESKMQKILIMFLFLFLFLSGCAGFRDGGVSVINNFPSQQKRTNLALNISHAMILNGNRMTNENVRVKLTEKFMERFKKSGVFSNIDTDPYNSDYTLDVQWENYGEMNQFLSVLTGLTFYIVPSSSKDTNIITAKLINNKTKKEETVMLQDGVTMWQEILLLPLVFFKNPFVEINDMQNDLIDNLIIWTHKNM